MRQLITQLTHNDDEEYSIETRRFKQIQHHLTVTALKQTYFKEEPQSAGCVQHSIDSRNSAIHGAYRILLRPSSLLEPRHPSIKVVRK